MPNTVFVALLVAIDLLCTPPKCITSKCTLRWGYSLWIILFSCSMLVFWGVPALEMLLAIVCRNTSPSARSLQQRYLAVPSGITILEDITAYQHIPLSSVFKMMSLRSWPVAGSSTGHFCCSTGSGTGGFLLMHESVCSVPKCSDVFDKQILRLL